MASTRGQAKACPTNWQTLPPSPRLILRGRMARKCALLAIACIAAAQPLAFDVASVKPTHTAGGNSTFNTQPAGLEGTNDTLSALIRWAYHLEPNQLSGPAWLDTESFDIVAKASHEVKADELRQMLQTLLEERFKLAGHREENNFPSMPWWSTRVASRSTRWRGLTGTCTAPETVWRQPKRP